MMNYWKFFFKNRFEGGDKLHIFDNGSFAIEKKDECVLHYSNECELIAGYKNAIVFENGCIAVKTENTVDIYCDGELRYNLDYAAGTHIRKFANAIVLTTEAATDDKTATHALYGITKESAVMMSSWLGSMISVIDVSSNNQLISLEHVGENRLITNQGERVCLEPFSRVDFMPNGGYIVYYLSADKGCAFYNIKHQRLVHSTQNFGIIRLGDELCFQQALIVSSATGEILGKYQGEKAVYDYARVFSYEFSRTGEDRHFHFGVSIQKAHINGWGDIFYYFYDGRFYIIPPVNTEFCVTEPDVPTDDEWGIYITQILSFIA